MPSALPQRLLTTISMEVCILSFRTTRDPLRPKLPSCHVHALLTREAGLASTVVVLVGVVRGICLLPLFYLAFCSQRVLDVFGDMDGYVDDGWVAGFDVVEKFLDEVSEASGSTLRVGLRDRRGFGLSRLGSFRWEVLSG